MIKRVLAILLLTLTSVWAADTLTKEQVSLSATDRLTIEHPATFQYDVVKDPADEFRPALRLRVVGADGTASLNFKIFANQIIAMGPRNQAELEASVKKMGSVYALGAVEKTNVMQPLHLPEPGNLGAYCVYTDISLVDATKLPPDQFRTVTVGLIRIGNYLFTIRGGANDKAGPDFKTMLGILEGLKLEHQPVENAAAPEK